MADELTKRVIAVMARSQRMAAERISPDSTFEELGIDSLDAVNILFALEEEFQINVPDEQAREIRTVRQMVDGIRTLIESGSAGTGMPG